MLLKNPYIITIISGVLSYTYLYYDVKTRNKINKKKNKISEKIEVNYLIPIAIMILVFIISYKIFGDNLSVNLNDNLNLNEKINLNEKLIGGNLNLNLNNMNNFNINNLSDGFANNKYMVINKSNIKLPSENVFIDLAKF